MLYMKKTPAGTVSCKRHDTGISIGKYNETSVASLEYEKDKLVLKVNTENCNKNGISLQYTDSNWEPAEKA